MASLATKLAWALVIIVILIVVIVAVYSALCWVSDVRVRTISADEADLIVVGAGTAGCVVARRLHDTHPHLKILILERGADRQADPRVFNIAQALEVAYATPYSEVLPVQTIPTLEKYGIHPTVSIATMNGGGTSHNFGLLVKGSPHLYDTWKTDLGVGYHELQKTGIFARIDRQMSTSEVPLRIDALSMIGPALKKAYQKYDAVEATRILERTAYVARHAGPLRAPDDLSDALLKALQRTRPQLSLVRDYNGDVEACASKHPRLFVDGELGIRSSSDISYLPRSYLNSARNHSCIQIAQNALVSELAFNHRLDTTSESVGDLLTCKGVNWTDQDGQNRITKLRKGGRVMLAAGGIHSPLLLQKSLPATYLAGGGEIGTHLLNHYGCTLIFKTKTDFNYSSGPVTFVPDSRHPGKDRRDWQMILGGEVLLNPVLLTKVGLTPDSGNYSSMLTWLLHPRSQGSLQSTAKGPQITLGMYTDGPLSDQQSDLASLVRALRWMYQLVREMRQRPPFSLSGGPEYGGENGKGPRISDPVVVFPPEEVLERDNAEELAEWVKIGLSQTDHYSGTCPIGKVLNPEDFSVRGTTNVHVVDASTFPSLPNGNTAYPTLVMAEIAAARISKHYL
jgi:choline dehydrogenase-like flavoprotein